jgi:hypothetical protein
MNTSRKVILAVAVALNLAAIGAVSGVIMHRHASQQANTIQLGSILVTPADVEADTVSLGAIMVTPSAADWRYAQTHGTQRPAVTTIALGAIVVQPTAEQLADAAVIEAIPGVPANQAVSVEDVASASLVEALEAFSPGKYLDTDATLRIVNALVFEHSGS